MPAYYYEKVNDVYYVGTFLFLSVYLSQEDKRKREELTFSSRYITNTLFLSHMLRFRLTKVNLGIILFR
jgi:hypothetical protein